MIYFMRWYLLVFATLIAISTATFNLQAQSFSPDRFYNQEVGKWEVKGITYGSNAMCATVTIDDTQVFGFGINSSDGEYAGTSILFGNREWKLQNNSADEQLGIITIKFKNKETVGLHTVYKVIDQNQVMVEIADLKNFLAAIHEVDKITFSLDDSEKSTLANVVLIDSDFIVSLRKVSECILMKANTTSKRENL